MNLSRRRIGGTDLAAVASYFLPQYADEWTRWSTAADLWMRLVWGVSRPQTAPMLRGLEAEPRLRKAYLDAYGGEFWPRPEKWILEHPRVSCVSVSPDDVWLTSATYGQSGVPDYERVYVEFKSASRFGLYPPSGAPSKWGPPESDKVPEGYELQVQLGMDVLGIDTAHIFVGFGDDATDENGRRAFYYSETRRYVLHRDPALIASALAFAQRFHDEHVVTRIPPNVEPRDNLLTWRVLQKLSPQQLDEIRVLVNGGASHRSIAKRFGLTAPNVGRLVQYVLKEKSCQQPTEVSP